eukprot:1833367-Rhodomonas_salina.1
MCPSVAYTHNASTSGRSCQNLQGACQMPAQSKQCSTTVLALRSAAFLPCVQLLAGHKDATTMGVDDDIRFTFDAGFTFDVELDLHPWGCYMVAKLLKEHQL